jgi:hypothetical protein
MNKKYYNLPSIVFNIIETLLLVWMAFYLKIGLAKTLTIFFTFQISRFYFKFPKHYKDWKKCLIWTLLIFTSMFVVVKINIFVGCLNTIFCAYILSGKADINDMYMWKPQNTSVHQPLIDYLKYNAICDDYLRAEELLKQKVDSKTYLIYKRKFIDGYSYERICEEFDMSNPRVKECLDKCYYFLIGRLNI